MGWPMTHCDGLRRFSSGGRRERGSRGSSAAPGRRGSPRPAVSSNRRRASATAIAARVVH
eukprot:20671-Pelagococcus_subviridis.AAC.4